MAKFDDLTGRIFGRLTVVSRLPNNEKGGARWHCICECGNTKDANASDLKKGSTKSCGCLAHEQKIAAGKSRCHAFSKAENRREKTSWENMVARCHNPNARGYENYGGRGIEVCQRWRESFPAFLEDMGKKPPLMTLDRIDNALGYSQENCQWATMKAQGNNRRTNHHITVNGETRTISQWADHLGISCHVLHTRIYKGMSDHDAVLKSMV